MSDSVQQIKDRLSIVDVVGQYVELRPAGKNFKGKSPFSAEKTPSFYVSPERGMYYCFSTSQGGDMFTFVQKMEGVDFKESLRLLAEKAGVQLVPEKPEQRTKRDRTYMVLKAACEFYLESLDRRPDVRAYVLGRGVTSDTLAAWQIGYAPGPPNGGWRELKAALMAKGFTEAELLTAGLAKATERGKESFDVFRDRVMFPLFDQTGRVVAFSGRIFTKDTEAPKYVNSPETEVYKKSDLLYGYHAAKEGIRKFDFSLLVEGQFDVVLCHQSGYINTVAVSGTALTLHHVQLLERLSRRTVLALDADRAGIAAMKRAAELMLTRGFDVKVAVLPEGQDPADCIVCDVTTFKRIVGQSVHVIEFLLQQLRRTHTDDRTFKLRMREEVLPFVLLLPNRIDQDHFTQLIAETANIAIESVRFEIDRLRETQAGVHIKGVAVPEEVPARSSETRLVEYAGFLMGAVSVLPESVAEFVDKEYKHLSEILPQPITPSQNEHARAVLHDPSVLLTEVLFVLNQFRAGVLSTAIQSVRVAQRAAEQNGDMETSLTLTAQLSMLEIEKRKPSYDTNFFSQQ